MIICAQAVVDGDRGGAADLIRTAGQGGLGLAVVLGADTGLARWRLEVDDGLVALKANDAATAAFRTEPVDSEMSLGLASLVQIASQLDGVPPDAPPYDKLQVADAGQEVDADQEASGSELAHEAPIAGEAKAIDGEPAAAVREGPEVQVRVLGPIEIEGAARPFTRAWAVLSCTSLCTAMERRATSGRPLFGPTGSWLPPACIPQPPQPADHSARRYRERTICPVLMGGCL